MYEFTIYFLIFSFLGWCAEVCFAAFKDGKFVNRGFLNGPVCPIYGFGVAGVHFVTSLISHDAVLVAVSFFLPTLLELVTGFVLEKVFRHKWWDYSKERWNLGGYVCARFSLLWGLVCISAVKIIFPLVDKFIAILPFTATLVVIIVLCSFMLIDFIGTVATIVKLNKRLKALDAINAKIHALSDKMGKTVADGTLKLISAKEKLIKRPSVFTRRIIKAFPTMSTKKYNSFDELKATMDKRSKITKTEEVAENNGESA